MRFPLAVLTMAMLAAVPAGVGAQPLRSTGLGNVATIDPNWTFRFGNTGSYGNAFVLNRSGGVPGSHMWIYGTDNGSTAGGSADGNLTRFSYWISTTFSGLTSFTYRCAIDDQFASFGSLRINGSAVVGAGCDQYTLSTVFTVSNLSSGTNTLEFNWGGNGITDGAVIEITSQMSSQVVPEPSTWGLMAMGLAGVLGMARRRRA